MKCKTQPSFGNCKIDYTSLGIVGIQVCTGSTSTTRCWWLNSSLNVFQKNTCLLVVQRAALPSQQHASPQLPGKIPIVPTQYKHVPRTVLTIKRIYEQNNYVQPWILDGEEVAITAYLQVTLLLLRLKPGHRWQPQHITQRPPHTRSQMLFFFCPLHPRLQAQTNVFST
jgi:hypothetical protein